MAYIAEGFHHDAKNLLDEFALKKSSDFAIFTAIWIKKNFSFVYMGRETAKELGEFTSEIFNVSSNFLTHESFYYQVGAVFLLYSLYRNQILQPPVRIRMVICKFEIMKILLEKAIACKLHSLHYVLEYLFQNAFYLVANPTLLGPGVRLVDKVHNVANNAQLRSAFKSSVVELKENKVLESLQSKLLKYEERKPPSQRCFSSDMFKKLINSLDKLVEEKPTNDNFDINRPVPLVPAEFTKDGGNPCRASDSDFNPTTDVDDPPAERAPVKQTDTKKMVVKRTKCRKDNVKDEPCHSGWGCNTVVEPSKHSEFKQYKRRNSKTRRIRQYYESEPRIEREMPIQASPSVDRVEPSDSDDDFAFLAPDPTSSV